jgi:hypothetical protein
MSLLRCIAVCAVSLFVMQNALGQEADAILSGTVSDSTGAIVPGVSLVLTNTQTGVALAMSSNESGVFLSPSVPPGTYILSAEKSGFKKFVLNDVVLSTGDRASVTVKLDVGSQTETIVVTGDDAPMLEYNDASIAKSITGSQVQQLPLVDRDALSLVNTTAGAQGANIGGAQRNALNISMDGINIQDLRTNFGLTTPMFTSVDRVGEVQVVSSPADAEMGRGVGHIVITSRGGTNRIHGALFEQMRNTDLNANTFFNNLNGLNRNILIRNQFGGSVDGPIRKDRTFFRFHWEAQRLAQQSTVTNTVLTAQARQGIFRFFPGVLNGNAGASAPTVDSNGNPLQPAGSSGGLQSVSLFGKDPTRLAPDPTGAMQKALAATPLPNNFLFGDGLNTGGFTWQRNSPFPRTQWDFRIDHYFTPSERLAINFTHENSDNPNGNQPAPFPTIPGGTLTSFVRIFSINLSSTLRPNLINEFRGGFNRPNQQYRAPWDLQGPGYLPTLSGTPQQLGASTFTSPYGNNNNPTALIGPYGRITPVYQVADSITWLKGRHTWKTGLEVWDIVSNGFNAFNVLPRVNLGNGFNGAPQNITSIAGIGSNGTLAQNMLNDLSGTVDSITQAFNIDGPNNPKYVPGLTKQRTWTSQEYNWFLKDDFRFSKNITFNIGMRYEYYRPLYDSTGRTAALVGGSGSIFGISGNNFGAEFQPGASAGALTNVLLVDKNSPNPDGRMYSPDRNNFSPAVGVSWKLPSLPILGHRSVVLRTGYGWAYEKIAPRHVDDASGSMPGVNFVYVYRAPSTTSLSNSTLPLVPTDAPLTTVPFTDRSQTVHAMDANLRLPYVQNWNFGLEAAVTNSSTLRVTYVGSKGTRLYSATNINEDNIWENGILSAFQVTQAGGSSPLMTKLFQGLNVPGVGVVDGTSITGSDAVRRNTTMNAFLAANDVGGFANFLNTNNFITGQIGGLPRRVGLPENWITVNPQFLSANLTSNYGSSTYHSLQVEYSKRLSKGLNLNANYTLAKALGDEEGDQTAEQLALFRTLRNRSLSRRLLGFSIKNAFKMAGVYELPFGPNRAFLSKPSQRWISQVVGGWQVGWVMTKQSGAPLAITMGASGDTYNQFGLATPVALTAVPYGLGTATRIGNGATYFSGYKTVPDPIIATYPTDFRARSTLRALADSSGNIVLVNPAIGTLGSLDQRPFVGPGLFDLDFNLIRTFSIRERWRLRFRADANAITNTPQWGAPNMTLNGTTFGQITTATGNRIVTLEARISF